MMDGNIADCNMYGHVQNKQKETCIESKKTRIGSITNHRGFNRRLAGLGIAFTLTLIIFAIFMPVVSAAGTPTSMIIFTDKKVYVDWAFHQDGHNTAPPPAGDAGAFTSNDLAFFVYAIVLDDDGNMMIGRAGSLSGSISTTRLDHWDKADTSVHHAEIASTRFDDASLTFVDDGSVSGDVAGDGVYVALSNPADPTDGTYYEDHFLLNITITDDIAGTEYASALVSGVRCKSAGTGHGKHSASGTTADNCAACHPGYEHFFENISETIPDSQLDVHFGVMNPPDVILDDKGFGDWIWNSSSTVLGTVTGVEWGSSIPGSRYCPACHIAADNDNIYDLGGGGRSDLADKPSCGQEVKTGLYENGATVTCHVTTEMQDSNIPQWSPAGATSTGMQNYNIANAQSHSHESNSTGVPCALCHSTPHALAMPNMTADISANGNINEQCYPCHSTTGPAGTAKYTHDSSTTDCSNCHLDGSTPVALDSHLVPEAGIPNGNCSECHVMGGKAKYHVDYNIMNNPDYVHYNLNNNSVITGASNGEEDRICWACHGYSGGDSQADFDEQPTDGHSSNYNLTSAHNCTYCHHNDNTNTNFNAPQNRAHTWYDDEINTPGVSGCEDCHAETEMYNTSHVDDDHVTRIGLAVHYGTGHTYLENVRHTDTYCKYCHMNTSTTFSDAFSNPWNMQRSEHSSSEDTPGCTVAECHNAYALHGTEMTEPYYTDASCTSGNCHNSSEFQKHNGAVNCTECHMNNTQTNIHPIKYLQLDGITFSTSLVTAAPCVTCHQDNVADAIMAEWGHMPQKVEHQSHSEDPTNGSKWGDFWDYVPDVFTFPTSWARNEMNDSTNTNSTIANFAYMTATNESATRIQETSGGAYSGDQPDNHDFPNATLQNWASSGDADRDVTMGWELLADDDEPKGSVYVQAIGRNTAATAYWNGSFYYSNSKTIAYASIQLDSRMITSQGAGATGDFTVYIDNGTALTEVYNRTYTVAETKWVEMEPVEIMGASQLFNVDSTYEVVIESNLVCANLKTTEVKVGYDNVHVVIKEEDFQLYNYTFNIDNVPNGQNYDYELYVGYQAHIEPASLYLYNGSTDNFEYKATLAEGAFTKVKIDANNFSDGNYNDGNVKVRINDTNNIGVDTDSDYFDIQYIFVHGYKLTSYPCEYCHAPDKHFANALGIPAQFAGDNVVNQSINSTTNWCASCHYEGYVSGSATYSDVVTTFEDYFLPIPPEISNHSNINSANQSHPDYYEHDLSSSSDDENCFKCHKGGLDEGARSTMFMHNVSLGETGGPNCTECHDIGMSIENVDVSGMNTSMNIHYNLNKDGTTLFRWEDRMCWGCHVTNSSITSDGRVDYSELAVDDHPTNYSKPAACTDCHLDGGDFSASIAVEHVPLNYATGDISTNASDYCGLCHNNSLASFTDPNNNNPMNASASHYATNATLPAGCTWCHYDNPNNVSWQSPIDPTIGESSSAHTGKNDDDCATCHGGSGTLHDESWGRGAGSCDTCHAQPPNGTLPFNRTGAHDLHKAAGYGDVPETSCDYCHSDGGLNESHPNNSTNVTTNASASIATYIQNTTSGNDDTCSGVSCHANSTISAGANIGMATWDTATADACANCHSTETTGIPPTGNHVTHYANNNYTCAECHGTDADAGTQSGHRNNALIDISFTNVSGGINASKGCAVYCHSPNTNDVRPDPTWNVSTVACDGCHSIPPTAFTTQNNKSHPASSGSDCNNCHGIDAVTGDHTGHLNGSVDTGSMTCDSCHAQPPSGTARYNMTGAHDLHKVAGYGAVPETSCDYCHIDGGLNESHPNNSTNVTTNASASIATYIQNTTSGDDDTCSGVSCHANSTISAGANIGMATWDTATADACANCHSTETTGIPPTGNHVTHYANNNYTCAECHGTDADAGTQSGHRNNALIDISFTNVSGSINASKGCAVYCHSPNTNDVRPDPTWNVSTVACDGCHSIPPATVRNGTAHTTHTDCDACHGAGSITGTQTGHVDGIIHTSATICDTCHSQPPSGTVQPNMVGAHNTHNSSTFQILYGALDNDVSCNYCHNNGGSNESAHPQNDSSADVVTNATVSITTYVQNATSGNDDTCSGVSCHTNGLIEGAVVDFATWNNNTGACDICHSTETSGLPDTDNHSLHYATKGYPCDTCHGTNAGNGSQSGHMSNSVIDINFTGLSAGTFNAGTCDEYCHSPNPNDPKPDPIWGVSTVECGDCHSIILNTTRSGTAHSNDSDCDNCHGIGATNGTQIGHVNGIITDVLSCLACHDTVTAADLGLHSSFTGTSAVGDGDCSTCHFALPHPEPNSNNTYYCEDCHTAAGTASPKSSILFTDKMHGEATCADCHIADGTHHQGDPRGAVANTTYVNRYVPGNTTVTDCADCHYARNLDDAPFYAPGGGSHTVTPCAVSCHSPHGSTMPKTMHNVNPISYDYKPSITAPSLNVSTVNQGAVVTVTATVSVSNTTRQYVDGGQYRIMNGATEALPWTVMDASDGDFWGLSGAATAIINTTALSSGIYTVEVRGMASGPATNAAVKYYPMNGDLSATQSTSFTVEPPTSYINGTVTSGGSPVAGIAVSIAGASTTTATDGTYSLNLMPGSYNVTASKLPEYADSTSIGVVVVSDTTTTQDFVLLLNPTGSITGTVTNSTV